MHHEHPEQLNINDNNEIEGKKLQHIDNTMNKELYKLKVTVQYHFEKIIVLETKLISSCNAEVDSVVEKSNVNQETRLGRPF